MSPEHQQKMLRHQGQEQMFTLMAQDVVKLHELHDHVQAQTLTVYMQRLRDRLGYAEVYKDVADITLGSDGVVRARRELHQGETATITQDAYYKLYPGISSIHGTAHRELQPDPMRLVVGDLEASLYKPMTVKNTGEHPIEVGQLVSLDRVAIAKGADLAKGPDEEVSFMYVALELLPDRVRSDSSAELTYREREKLVAGLIENGVPVDFMERLAALPNPLVVERVGSSEGARIVEPAPSRAPMVNEDFTCPFCGGVFTTVRG